MKASAARDVIPMGRIGRCFFARSHPDRTTVGLIDGHKGDDGVIHVSAFRVFHDPYFGAGGALRYNLFIQNCLGSGWPPPPT